MWDLIDKLATISLVPKLRLGNAVLEAGASLTGFPSRSVGTSAKLKYKERSIKVLKYLND